MPLRNKNSGVAACALLALTVSLTGCENIPWNPDRWGADRLDVSSTEGRTGSVPMNYETLMRLGAAARAGGGIFHAAQPHPRPGPIRAYRDTPLHSARPSLPGCGRGRR